MINSTNDTRLLRQLLPLLETAADQAPPGKLRWSCRCYLADALQAANQAVASLRFYQEADAEARAAQHWANVAWINGNWAIALIVVGQPDLARDKHRESADAHRRAGNPAINVLGSELEALRIDIRQGNAAEALPEIETRLARIENWYGQSQAGQAVPETPDREFLLRVLIGALDIATDAHYALQQWPQALQLIDRIIEIKRAAGRAEAEIAVTRINRATVLQQLGQPEPARAELEALLTLRTAAGDHYRKAKVLGSLASLYDDLGDFRQAVDQQRRALALFNQFDDPQDRAISHHNLANYLERSGDAAAESPWHQLAALVYCLVAGLGQHLQTSLGNYAIDFRRARQANPPAELSVPRLAELTARPDFEVLREWLERRGVDMDELQAKIDQFLQMAREA